MILAAYPRREHDLLAPFEKDGHLRNLIAEYCATVAAPEVAWDQYRRDGNAEALAKKRSLFFRAIFTPSLAQALGPSRDAEDRRAFANALEIGLDRRLAENPQPIENLVGIIVVAGREDECCCPANS